MNFEFQRHRIDKITRAQLLDELQRVAIARNLEEFGKREFNLSAQVHSSTVRREFGSWANAMECLRQELKLQGKELLPKHRGYFTRDQALNELERVWGKLGHRPSRIEWESSGATIGYNTYVRYFGSWTNAVLFFLESRAENRPSGEIQSVVLAENLQATPQAKKEARKRQSRDVPPGLRLRVYERDRFRCRYCGRTPVTDLSIQLHVDHIHPFAKGGDTVLENLQTLCSACNLGKSDRTDVVPPCGS
jgi:hypothetical protein